MSKERNVLFEKVADGEFVVSAQIDPPSEKPPTEKVPGDRLEELYREIPLLQEAGVEIVDVNSSRRLTHDSISLSIELSNKFSLEVIPHVTPRDASTLGVMRQVLSAATGGNIKNFLIIRGDPHEESEISRNVFHSDAPGLIAALDTHLRKSTLGLDFKLGAALNQNNGLAVEAERIKLKEAAGTDFFMSQTVFNFVQAILTSEFHKKHSTKPLIIGIWPVISARTLENIHAGKITGVVIPEAVYEEYREKADPEILNKFGTEKAIELIKFIKAEGLAQGVYVVAPFRKPSRIAKVVASWRGLDLQSEK